MKSLLFAMLSLVFVIESPGETLSLSRSTATLDDIVKLTLVADDADPNAEDLEVPISEGLVVASRTLKRDVQWVPSYPAPTTGFIRSEPKRNLTLEILLRPTRAGTFRIGPVEIPHSNRPVSTAPAVTLNVSPNPDLTRSDTFTAFRTLKQAGMIPAHFYVEAPKTAYVGEMVMVRWTVATEEELEDVTVLEIPFIDEALVPNAADRHSRFGWADTAQIRFRGLRDVFFFASAPGPLQVGSMTIRASVRSHGDLRTNESHVSGLGPELIRSTAPFTIEILPLPAGVSAAAVGDLSLTCSSFESVGGAWTATATVHGRASLLEKIPPQWSNPPDFQTEISLGPLHDSPPREQRWTIRIPPVKKSRFVTVPSLVVNRFNTKTSRMEQVSCWEQMKLPLLTEETLPIRKIATGDNVPHAPQRDRLREMIPWAKTLAILAFIVGCLTLLRRSTQ